MIDYEQTVKKKIINSINFSFEFDFELVKKKWNYEFPRKNEKIREK